jgi:hypothetical protein
LHIFIIGIIIIVNMIFVIPIHCAVIAPPSAAR